METKKLLLLCQWNKKIKSTSEEFNEKIIRIKDYSNR